MAQRITEIQLNNFKFFGDNSAPINVDGKNLLIYGENGSGKSSIFWGLYTLLECANKEEDDIKKYFLKTHKDTLVNIYATPDANDKCNSFVSVKLDDGVIFKISIDDTNINSDSEAKKSNYATDFINYKFIAKTHDFKHSDEINLFPMFERFILPYVKFSPVKYWKKKRDGSFEELETENANEIWNFVKNGPLKNLVAISGKARYPYRKEVQFTDYSNMVFGFQNELRQLLTYVITEGNPILNTYFDANVTYNLTLEIVPTTQKYSFYLTQQRFRPPVYKILLTVPTYYGFQNAINRPHSFLNEAKLTGIGLALRLAVLKKRAEDAKVKALVLDDLLISLDMVHRERMIDLVTGTYARDYQIFYFTHDLNLFELMKNTIRRNGNESAWKYYEMYEDNQTGVNFPFITESITLLEKAKKYLRKLPPDLASSANNMRKAVEKFCEQFVPVHLLFNRNFVRKDLSSQIAAAVQQASTQNLNPVLFRQLDGYRQTLFNPGSHYNLSNPPLFKPELERAIQTLENLSTLTNIQL